MEEVISSAVKRLSTRLIWLRRSKVVYGGYTRERIHGSTWRLKAGLWRTISHMHLTEPHFIGLGYHGWELTFAE